ncbi:MAG: hypothetical protein RLN75_07845, partial [Longimicrobiales bacterium]
MKKLLFVVLAASLLSAPQAVRAQPQSECGYCWTAFNGLGNYIHKFSATVPTPPYPYYLVPTETLEYFEEGEMGNHGHTWWLSGTCPNHHAECEPEGLMAALEEGTIAEIARAIEESGGLPDPALPIVTYPCGTSVEVPYAAWV